MSTQNVNIGLYEEISKIIPLSLEPRREKTGFLHMRKQRSRSALR